MHANEDIFQYKDSFIGDNSAVVNLTNQLRNGEHVEGFELNTKEQPYGIIINYDLLGSEQDYIDTALYNATFLFVLVQNVDYATFHFGKDEYTVTKENLQDWYGEELSEFTNEEKLTRYVQKQLENENKVNQFFN
ncbi:DUF4825 domain-containing protein [Aquibacillus koreensis]|uniref:DUF4825 domain-containing protein n=1 Tax=Aquibacillus koreensis TaxID=279446 RepID=A0A9X3WNR5_9BACI|nr:DUF4825 domain-containing protein [Aquibacillus koreensis]MCT2536885.1 DUF4825 domain-containing protein [Aquibacillus koreensis]MDC3421983.1 DUF4825 domain-containing protein [Aquibacillus koreensis]